METRVSKSSFSGIKGAKKERKLLEKSSQSFLGPGCREFESRHSDQISRNGFMPFLLISFGGETRKIKCNADERCRRRLDGGEPLSAPSAQMQTSLATRYLCTAQILVSLATRLNLLISGMDGVIIFTCISVCCRRFKCGKDAVP